jgi:hypothetical protein
MGLWVLQHDGTIIFASSINRRMAGDQAEISCKERTIGYITRLIHNKSLHRIVDIARSYRVQPMRQHICAIASDIVIRHWPYICYLQ